MLIFISVFLLALLVGFRLRDFFNYNSLSESLPVTYKWGRIWKEEQWLIRTFVGRYQGK